MPKPNAKLSTINSNNQTWRRVVFKHALKRTVKVLESDRCDTALIKRCSNSIARKSVPYFRQPLNCLWKWTRKKVSLSCVCAKWCMKKQWLYPCIAWWLQVSCFSECPWRGNVPVGPLVTVLSLERFEPSHIGWLQQTRETSRDVDGANSVFAELLLGFLMLVTWRLVENQVRLVLAVTKNVRCKYARNSISYQLFEIISFKELNNFHMCSIQLKIFTWLLKVLPFCW